MVLVGTLGKQLQLLAVDQDDSAWIVMWVTHSRPLGVRVLPVSKGNFYDPHFKTKRWTMVVYWDELENHRRAAVPPRTTSTTVISPPSSGQPPREPPKIFSDPNLPLQPMDEDDQSMQDPGEEDDPPDDPQDDSFWGSKIAFLGLPLIKGKVI